MATLTVRTDSATEAALAELATKYGSRSDAVRHAVLRAYKEELVERARADAQRLSADADDRAEMLAIQRFMGVGV